MFPDRIGSSTPFFGLAPAAPRGGHNISIWGLIKTEYIGTISISSHDSILMLLQNHINLVWHCQLMLSLVSTMSHCQLMLFACAKTSLFACTTAKSCVPDLVFPTHLQNLCLSQLTCPVCHSIKIILDHVLGVLAISPSSCHLQICCPSLLFYRSFKI